MAQLFARGRDVCVCVWTPSFISKMQVSLERRVLFLFLFLSLVCIRMQSRQEKSSVNLDSDGGLLRLSRRLRSAGIQVSCSENDSDSSSAVLGEERIKLLLLFTTVFISLCVCVLCFSPGFLRKGLVRVVFYDYYFATIGKCCIYFIFLSCFAKKLIQAFDVVKRHLRDCCVLLCVS